MTLILSSQSSDSYFGLFSKDVQCTPENRGQHLYHSKMLRLFGTAEHCCNCVIHHVFATVSCYPSPQIMSSVKVMEGKPVLKWGPAVLDDHSPRGNTGCHCLGPWISGRYLLFLGGSTDIASFLLLFLFQHHLGCTRLTSKLDITAATSLTFTTSPFITQGMLVLWLLSFIHRESTLELLSPQPLQHLPDLSSSKVLGMSSSTAIQVNKAGATIIFRPS